MTTSDSSKQIDPPLVDVKVTNPITYIKKWWAKVINNEGIDFRLRIKPLTAIALAISIAAIGFGVGRFVLPFNIPFFEYTYSETPTPSSTPTIETQDWKETAYIGKLQYSTLNKRYFLITSSSAEAITLDVPSQINLSSLIGNRIFAIGSYNKTLKVLKVSDYKDLEVLPTTPVPLPTNTPSPVPTTEPSPSPTASPELSPSPTASN